MSETLRFFLLQLTFLSVVLILHTYLGLHIIRRTIVFADLALAQIAALGVLIGIMLGISYGTMGTYLLSTVAVLIGSVILAVVKPKEGIVPREAVIGIVYALALVISLLIGDKISGGDTYIKKTLVGSMLWVSWSLVGITVAVYAVLIAFHYKYRHEFIDIIGKSKTSQENKWWDFLFFVSVGVITVLVIPISGVLLAYALLMIPAAIATMFYSDWKKALILGWGCGFAACLLGIFTSYYLRYPYGPNLVLTLGLFFFCAIIIRIVKNKKWGAI